MADTGERLVRFAPKQVKAAATPEASDIPALPADWSRYQKTLHRSPEEKRRNGDCDVWILQSVYRQVFDHLAHDTKREHGGLLLGFKAETPAGPAVVIAHSLPAHHTIGTPVRLEIQEDSWAEWDRIEKSALRSGLRRVGWYHSHPGIRIFLSRWDLDVCRAFPRPTDIAMVVDPVGRQGGFFVCGEEGYRSDSPQSFYEIHNVFSRSVVDWNNAIAEEVAPEPKRTLELPPPIESSRVSEKTGAIRPELREASPAKSQVRKSRMKMSLTALTLLWLVLASNFVLVWVVWRRVPGEQVNLQALKQEIADMQTDLAKRLPQSQPTPGVPNPPAQSPQALPPNPPAALAKWKLDKGPPNGLKPSETYQFKTNGNPPPDLVWSVSPADVGSIDNTGLYTAPDDYNGKVELTIKAASRADPKDAQSAKITLKGGSKKAAPASEAEGGGVTIIPAEATLEPSKTLRLTAQVQGTADQTVKWSIEPAEAGVIDQGGFYTAPADPLTPEVSVIATSKNGKSKTAKIRLKLTPKATPQ